MRVNDYKTEDLLSLLKLPDEYDDEDIVKSLTKLKRKYKGNTKYENFFNDLEKRLIDEGVLGEDMESEEEENDNKYDIDKYSIKDLLLLTGYDKIMPNPIEIGNDKKGMMLRIANSDKKNKTELVEFFENVYERVSEHLYGKMNDLVKDVKDLYLIKDEEIMQPNTKYNLPEIINNEFNQVPERWINPIQNSKQNEKVITVNVDTRFRREYISKVTGEVTDTNLLTFTLDEKIKNVTKIALSSLEFPNAAYAISEKNKSNCLFIDVTRNTYQVRDGAESASLAGTFPAVIPSYPTLADASTNGGVKGFYKLSVISGNYNKDTLRNALNVAFRTSDSSFGLAAITADYNTAYNKLILRNIDLSAGDAPSAAVLFHSGITITFEGLAYNGGNFAGLVNSRGDLHFDMYFDYFETDENGLYDKTNPDLTRPLFYNLGWTIGYRKRKYEFTKDYITYNSELYGRYLIGYNAEAPYDVNGMSYFYVILTDYIHSMNSRYIQGIKNDGDLIGQYYSIPKDVIARIVNVAPKLHKSFFDQSDFRSKVRYYPNPVSLQTFTVSLIDDFGRLADLNSMDWSCAFEITQLI